MRKPYKNGMLIILVILMVIGGFNGSFIGGEKAYAVGTGDFAGGKGTLEDPFQIVNAAQLDRIRDHVEVNKYFILIDDIDLSAYSEDLGWKPIGVYTTAGVFRGNLDGNGFKITNLKINRPDTNYNGLFTAVVSGRLTNIILENVEVNGGNATGGLVGRNQGIISNSTVTGSVHSLGATENRLNTGGLVGENYYSATITNSHSSASVSGGNYVGGLVGNNMGTINNSSSSGNVDGVEFTGGLVGLGETGFISDSSATGSVSGGNETGGLVGSNRGPISNSFATGIVHGTTVVGGLTGSNDSTSSISSSYAIGSVSGGNETGGLVGRNNGPISTSFATGIVHGATDTGGLTGSNEGVINSSYAIGNVSGTEDVGGLVGESSNTINTSFASGNVSGTEDVGGLVGASNHTITNSIASGQVIGVGTNVGGLAGANYGLATISNSSATGTVTGAVYYSGGLAGLNLGTIRTSFAVGNVTGSYEVGGLVGRSQGEISNSYATGSAIGSTDVGGLVGRNIAAPISNSYALGSVNGTEDIDVGGLVGYNGNDGSIIISSFYNYEISGHLNNADRGVGTITALMKTKETYTGWSFSDIWGIDSFLNDGYPYLNVLPSTAITGVTAPVAGATPITSVETTEYTAVVTWSTADATFEPITAYTATITLTPKIGYTLTGVIENFFTVAGAATTNSLDSGVIRAEFNATTLSSVATLTSTIGTVSIGGTANETITNIPNGTTLAALKAAINPALYATVNVYDANGTTEALTLTTGKKVIVTAQDGITKITYTVTVISAPSSNDGDSPTPSSTNDTITSTDGTLTLPTGRSGQVSLEDEVTVFIPVDATDKELKLTIEKVANTQSLLANQEVLLSEVFEILKNDPENFRKSVTLTFIIDSASLNSNQKAVVFYYDEVNRVWVEIGGVVSGKKITVDVDHFTKFAVFVVEKTIHIPKDDPSPDTKPTIHFGDILGHWAEANIKQAVSERIVSGYPDGTFKPSKTITRAEFTVLLMNVLKLHGEGVELTFTDIASIGAWAQKSVALAVQADIIKGYVDGTFGPNAEITRAEMAGMVANALDQSVESDTLTGFADDEDIPAWAKGSIVYMKETGIMIGKGDHLFAPLDHVTRAEAVTVMLNLLKQSGK